MPAVRRLRPRPLFRPACQLTFAAALEADSLLPAHNRTFDVHSRRCSGGVAGCPVTMVHGGRARARSLGDRAGRGFPQAGEGGLFPPWIVPPVVLLLVPLFQFVLDLDKVFQLSRCLPVAAG